jgi:hypothetical protein
VTPTTLEFEAALSHELELELEGGAEWEQALACPRRVREVVSGFSRYSNSLASLPREERARLKRIANLIVRSQRVGCQPLLRVRLVGHADRDLQAEAKQPGFLVRISRSRALAVKQVLDRLIGNSAISARIAWEVRGAGATQLVVPNATTEQAQRRNRRVEIVLNGGGAGPPDVPYIRWVQSCLNQVLKTKLALTGIEGPETQAAVRSFQQRRGLPPSGVITPQTAAALMSVCGSPGGTFSLPHEFQIETPGIQFTDFFTMQRRNLRVVGNITSQPDDPDTDQIVSYILSVRDQDFTVQKEIIVPIAKDVRQCAQWFHLGPGRFRLFIQTGSKIQRGRSQQPRLIGALSVTEGDAWPLC